MGESIQERLIDAAERLMRSGRTAAELTTREIAAEAKASIGTVNYHFGSKDALLAKAAERIFADFAPRWTSVVEAAKAAASRGLGDRDVFAAAAGELKALLKDLAETIGVTAEGSEFTLRRELMEGELSTTKFLAGILKSVAPAGADERELRWAAFFIVAPLQLLFLRREWLSEWTWTNLDDRIERDRVIDFIVDRILEPFAGEPGKALEITR